MEFKDYYQILGVEPGADEAAIKSAYRRLARKYHPDVSKEAGAEDRFKSINEAYEVLRDKGKRTAYDQVRAGGYRPGDNFSPPPGWQPGGATGFGGDAGGFSDFFDSLFGAGARQRPTGGQMPRREVRATLALDLAQVHAGGATRIDVDGRTLEVKIPAGIQPGQQIRLAGQGGQGRDLLLEIAYRSHPQFEVEGRDIIHRLDISPWLAALGGERSVPTLGGSVNLRIPAGSDSGRRMRLRGRGLPGKPAGDQYVLLEVRAPAASTDEQREAYAKLAEAFGEVAAETTGAG